MGDVIAMHGQTVDELLAQLNQMHADGGLASLVVATVDRNNDIQTGISIMTVERAVYLADKLLQDARNA